MPPTSFQVHSKNVAAKIATEIKIFTNKLRAIKEKEVAKGVLNQPKAEKKEKDIEIFPNRFYSWEFLLGIISFGIPFGWSVSGFPPCIELACASWGVTLIIILHYFWVWARNRRWWKLFTWLIIIGVPVLISIFSWKPIAAQYCKQHSFAPVVDPSPKFEVRINDFTNQIVNGSVFPIQKGEGIVFFVVNYGSNSAKNLTVDFFAPLNSSNVASSGWELQPPMREGAGWKEVKNQTHWLTKKYPGDLQGHLQAAWGTAPLVISTNTHIPIFDRKAIEHLDFVIKETNCSEDFLIPHSHLPVELIVSADDNVFEKRVFFFNLTNDYTP
jgi:hypothetical protein